MDAALRAASNCSMAAPSKEAGASRPESLASVNTSEQALRVTPESSSVRKLASDGERVRRRRWTSSPSSSPCGWGGISLGRTGRSVVALSHVVRVPSGSRRMIRAWGFTMAVPRRYS